MLFNTMQYILFLLAVVLVYYLLPKKVRYIWLLIVSYYFYMQWNSLYILLLFSCTFLTYVSGRIIGKLQDLAAEYNDDEIIQQRIKKKKRICLVICLLLNLCVLGYFKYSNFILYHLNSILRYIHLEEISWSHDIILPVGISFYTLQALGYLIDVYRGEIYAEKNFLRYALFVSFFPQLVAGPIERSRNLLVQLKEPHRFEYENLRRGLLLVLYGMFLKMVIADRAAIIVDTVYKDSTAYPGFYIAVATCFFAIQIYCDFYGYSTIAKGSALIMGIHLMDNFNAPYYSRSVKEFWRRWHISLSTWFKDYLYIPLGGNRLGKLRTKCNIMIVFLLSGLWHGASWNYVVWGGLNGLFQLGNTPVNGRERGIKKYLSIFVTFCLIDFTWLFFRAPGFRYGCRMLKQIWTLPQSWSVKENLVQMGFTKTNLAILAIALLILFAVDILHENKVRIRDRIAFTPAWLRWSIYLAACEMILLEIVIRYGQPATAFLYFQF